MFRKHTTAGTRNQSYQSRLFTLLQYNVSIVNGFVLEVKPNESQLSEIEAVLTVQQQMKTKWLCVKHLINI